MNRLFFQPAFYPLHNLFKGKPHRYGRFQPGVTAHCSNNVLQPAGIGQNISEITPHLRIHIGLSEQPVGESPYGRYRVSNLMGNRQCEPFKAFRSLVLHAMLFFKGRLFSLMGVMDLGQVMNQDDNGCGFILFHKKGSSKRQMERIAFRGNVIHIAAQVHPFFLYDVKKDLVEIEIVRIEDKQIPPAFSLEHLPRVAQDLRGRPVGLYDLSFLVDHQKTHRDTFQNILDHNRFNAIFHCRFRPVSSALFFLSGPQMA